MTQPFWRTVWCFLQNQTYSDHMVQQLHSFTESKELKAIAMQNLHMDVHNNFIYNFQDL